MLKANKKDAKKTSNDVVPVSLLLTFYIVLFINSTEFEQVNAGWAETLKKSAF